MLTHLHMIVKHLWCWHIYKGVEGDEVGDEVLPLGAPSPPVRCTTYPRVVTIWTRPRNWSWRWHRQWLCTPPQALRCTTGYITTLSIAIVIFQQRVGETRMGTTMVTATP